MPQGLRSESPYLGPLSEAICGMPTIIGSFTTWLGCSRKVQNRLAANRDSAVNSTRADIGSTCHAQAAYPWYARTSHDTRSMHPIVSRNSPANIKRGLHSSLIPANAGNIL